MMFPNGMRAVHPGEVLREEYLEPLGLSAHALARALHVPASRINDIVLERRGITPDTALRLTRYFGGDEQDALGWIHMQAVFDFKTAMHKVSSQIRQAILPRTAANPDINQAEEDVSKEAANPWAGTAHEPHRYPPLSRTGKATVLAVHEPGHFSSQSSRKHPKNIQKTVEKTTPKP